MEIANNMHLFGKNDGLKICLFDIEEPLLSHCLAAVYSEARRLEKIFNFYDNRSELCRLNKKRDMAVSKELLEVIKSAIGYSKITGGAYDISIGKKILARKSGRECHQLVCTYKDIMIHDNKVKLESPDVLIDLGSIAKGYIVDRIIEYMKSLGILSAIVDGRGDIRVYGTNSTEIFIQHPRKEKKNIYSFMLKDMAVATSGDYSQNYGGFNKSHIIGKKDVISATVISKTLADADAIATCLMCLDMEKTEDFLRKHRYSALLVDDNLNIHSYNNFLILGG